MLLEVLPYVVASGPWLNARSGAHGIAEFLTIKNTVSASWSDSCPP